MGNFFRFGVITRSPLILSLFLSAGVAACLAQEPVADDAIYSEPTPRHWPAPVYPVEAIKAGIEGRVTVGFVVDAEGRVVNPTIVVNKKTPADLQLSEAVLMIAKEWTFAPALNAGKAEARAVVAPINFVLKGRGGKPSVILPLGLQPAPTRPSKVISQPDPPYPDELLPRKLPGTAEYQFRVSAEGQVEDITVLYASDASFVALGIDTLKRWTFEPARQGPLKVESRKQAPMEFAVYGDNISPVDVLQANGISGQEAMNVDTPPVVHSLPAPVYPHARLLAGETGTAEVEFVVGENGGTRDLLIMNASEPEFGEALAAAVSLWVFKPAVRERTRTAVTLRAKHEFAVRETDSDARVLAALKDGISGAGGLDQPLKPLWRIAPRYPASLAGERPSGKAMIEFIIDREGRARFPRIASATQEAFGWAAAAAISQWVFAAPLRKGEPTDVRVSIPMAFAPPEQ